ncbi:MAG TPA: hypothetical protein EYP09_02900 [Anaerolineae bacterium]|nr:hypothetical protein [Anaerolineae bacterium]
MPKIWRIGVHSALALIGNRHLICKTIALHGKGVEAVAEAIERHRVYLRESGEFQRRERERIEAELRDMISQEMARRFFQRVDERVLKDLVDRIARRKLDPYSAVAMLLEGTRQSRTG